jgi:hypothetical protein
MMLMSPADTSSNGNRNLESFGVSNQTLLHMARDRGYKYMFTTAQLAAVCVFRFNLFVRAFYFVIFILHCDIHFRSSYSRLTAYLLCSASTRPRIQLPSTPWWCASRRRWTTFRSRSICTWLRGIDHAAGFEFDRMKSNMDFCYWFKRSRASSLQIPVSTAASCRSRRRSFQTQWRSRCRTDTRAIVSGRSLWFQAGEPEEPAE